MNIRNVDELVGATSRGQRIKYHLFWGHTAKVPGVVDKSCLSNWFPSSFEVEGVNYSTTEHYMMAEKARLFGDVETRDKILGANSPGAAKRFGRGVRGFDEERWCDARMGIVVRGNYEKFKQHENLRSYLLGTGNKVIVEASPADRIWGIGLAQDHENALKPQNWNGLNLLGFALMEVREHLLGGD